LKQQPLIRKIQSEFYGTFEVDESHIYHFPKGIIGFEDEHEYALIQVEGGPFHLLHSLGEQLSFVVLPGNYAAEEYGFRISQNMINLLEIKQPEDVMPFVIVNVIDDQLYANLKAPLIFNKTNHKGAQYIIDEADYPIRHPLTGKGGA